jgi:hypothetical protein
LREKIKPRGSPNGNGNPFAFFEKRKRLERTAGRVLKQRTNLVAPKKLPYLCGTFKIIT